MNQTTNQPCYSNNSIYSLAALSKCLGFEELFLTELAVIASSKYRLAKPITKPDGSIRQPFDAEEPLKEVHRRIKKEIFSKVVFPNYLTGSIKGCDYKVNAALHTDAKIVICEDVESFFPTTTTAQVFDIWHNFFGFSKDVANLLTALTTKNGTLPQGAITSSYLANLTFWRLEPDLYTLLATQNIRYSRYVDDITISSTTHLDTAHKTDCIALIYGMLSKAGYRAKRQKHEITTSANQMFTTKLMVNKKPSLTSKERANIRTAVYQLEQKISEWGINPSIRKLLNSVSGQVGKLSRFHPSEGNKLKLRIKIIRQKLVP